MVVKTKPVIFAGQKEMHRSGRTGWLRAAVLGADDAIVSTATVGFRIVLSTLNSFKKRESLRHILPGANLRLLYDDGGVVYLNGVEIYRTPTMPAGVITYSTLSGQSADNTIAAIAGLASARLNVKDAPSVA